MEWIEIGQPELLNSMAYIAFSPFFWNLISIIEYHTGNYSKLFFNKKRVACATLGAMVFFLNLVRFYAFQVAIEKAPHMEIDSWQLDFASQACIIIGQFLVITSTYRLGIIGTYHGDYFGIRLFDGPLTCFPFNVCNDPMYTGATMSFFGYALLHRSPVGLFLSGWVTFVYMVTVAFEGNMLQVIYSVKEKKFL